jgi:hypothetical protein
MTLLAKSYLKLLGLKRVDIDRDAIQAAGVKSKFTTWYSKVPLTAQVWTLAPATPPATGWVPMPWSPVFVIDPRFASRAPALAGRRDFFQHFIITFCEDSVAPFFVVTQK